MCSRSISLDCIVTKRTPQAKWHITSLMFIQLRLKKKKKIQRNLPSSKLSVWITIRLNNWKQSLFIYLFIYVYLHHDLKPLSSLTREETEGRFVFWFFLNVGPLPDSTTNYSCRLATWPTHTTALMQSRPNDTVKVHFSGVVKRFKPVWTLW